MRVLLELIRVTVFFAIFYVIFGSLLSYTYTKIGVNTSDKSSWIGLIAIVLLFFILYRNELQFSGWYTGRGRKRLPKRISKLLICISILLVLLPPILRFF